jgi:flagellar basal body-associated protein FliL
MNEVNETVARATGKPGRGSRFLSRKIIALLLVAVTAAAAAAGYYWYSAGRQPPQRADERAAEPPFYLELKPFVVSIASSTGTPRFLQIGLDLALSGKGAGNAVTAVLPEIQDALRQTALGFNAEEIVTPAGVERLRQAMIISANRLLMQRLGAAELKSLTGKTNGGVVQNILFSTLIVE